MITLPASIPSPSTGEWMLGPIPIRMYAIMILIGMVLGLILTNRRWQQRGGRDGTTYDIAIWAIPFGIIGARLYHVVTDWQLYFAEGGSGIAGAVRIWDGGLGIWGAVAGGALGAWIACRRRGIPLPHFADAAAPGVVLAQAVGRWGNYFNQELFGKPTDLPWGLQIAPENRPPGYEQYETFQPTFLYESLWNFGVLGVLLVVDRRFRIGHGRLFALYVALYTAGRVWIEALRIDTANTILGLRLNIWTSVIVFLAAVLYIVISTRLRPGRPDYHERDPEQESASDTVGAAGSGAGGSSVAEVGEAGEHPDSGDPARSDQPGAGSGPPPGPAES